MNSTFKKIIVHGFILSIIDASIVLISLFITNRGFYILSYEPHAVILSFILVLGINLLIYSFSNLIISVFITFNFFSFLSIVSLIKYELRNIPVVFNDIFIINEVNRINGYVTISDYSGILISALSIEILLVALYFWSRKKIDLKITFPMRIFGLFLSVFFISSSYLLIETTQISFEKSGPIYIFTSSIKNTSKYILTDTEEELLTTLLVDKDLTPISESISNPNIIIIMNEAFWDMDQLPNITIEPNPYEYFDSLKKESIHGRFEVPVFAGGTVNTEFEILTSLSTHMYEEGLMVFNAEIQKPIISLASILRHQGYKSVGLHPFWGWYYNRNLIYSHLGFDEFIF